MSYRCHPFFRLGLVCFCLVIGRGALAASAVEEGLVLWIKAAGQGGERERAGLPPLGRFQPVDLLVESISGKVAATQLIPAHRPTMVSDGEGAFLKFDGGQFMAVAGMEGDWRELTLFILAAPRGNPGNFTGIFSTAAHGANDYTTGLNLDFGPAPTEMLSVVNIEAAGAGGFRDLLVPGFFNAAERPFGGFHLFTVRAANGSAGIEFFLDGFKGGDRPRSDVRIGLDQIVLGGRLYSNDPGQPAFAQGFFEGAVAEVLLYNRALSDEERARVERGLLERTVPLNALLSGARGHALETVKDPPVAHMLVPGFTIEELPVKLSNLNNVRYRHDGKLVALGYDGRIHLLSDQDGDGLEEQHTAFWDRDSLRAPIGMALLGADDPRGDGVFVASKGKVSLILDRDRDGRAEEEIIVASGWPDTFHNVDALGVAVDPRDGSIYFGLGCANFVDPYLINAVTGRANYRLDDVRGTIQRVSADFLTRETICTGVRFTCALAFNAAGDLFATDQEGATWVPNGNPMDELLHIEQGKHYGFPARHPRHLPNVIDEPAVMEYGPQHQSTVGLIFNEGVNGGPHFGPAHWRGDALVTGAARGKLWRTRLAWTAEGNAAKNHLIGSFGMIVIDAAVSPQGDLVVACHGGPPDWGTGPAGEGRVFKIRYTGKSVPQPVMAWAAAPDEFRIAFDRPMDPADWAGARERIRIEAGPHVAAGDRFESIRPGYQIVRDQLATPRRWVELLGLTLTEDRRTLVLRVPRRTERVNHAVTLPLPAAWKQAGGISGHEEIDLLVDFNGVLAAVEGDSAAASVVLPHPSLEASAALAAGSADHERFLALARNAPHAIQGLVDLSNPFVPPAQPGSRVDWDVAADPFASKTFGLFREGVDQPVVSPPPYEPELAPRAFALNRQAGGSGELFLASDTLRHRLDPSRLYVPWLDASPASVVKTSGERDDLHGDWLRGRRLFLTEAGCATCHTVRGEGIAFGPDLSNLIHRDRDSVLADIMRPSATINPDQAGVEVALRDGGSLAGIVRSRRDGQITLGLPAGAEVSLAESAVAGTKLMHTSLMPDGLIDHLSAGQVEDLLTFLLSNPLEPAPITRIDPPPAPPRRIEELYEVLGGPPTGSMGEPPFHVLLCAGPKDHGADEHDYPLWLERWSKLLAMGENVTVSTSMGFPSEAQLKAADVVVFYNANPAWDAGKAAALDVYHERGGGAVYIHYAVDGGKDPAGAAERIGLAFTLGSRFRHGEFDLVFTQPDHPITRGFSTLRFTDETYWNMRGDLSRLDVLGTAVEDGDPRPELWTLERKKSRIVACIPGHYTWTFDDPLFRLLVLRSIAWSGRQENVDRLSELAIPGARVISR